MTLEEKFAKGVVVEKVNNDYVCEFWAASTKHPDATFYYSEWNDKTEFISDKHQVFQWLLWVASKMLFPFHAKEIVEYALENWYN